MNWTADDWQRLGTALREEREAQGLSRRALSEQSGISEKAIQVAEEGRVPSARWPKSIDALAAALRWGPGSARVVLEGGSPARPVKGGGTLARRMAENQIRMTVDDLARDADRLAEDAHRYADSLKEGKLSESGTAYRLVQSATEILRRAARLDGMRDIGELLD